jgi:hypothetical protein
VLHDAVRRLASGHDPHRRISSWSGRRPTSPRGALIP